MLLEEKRSKTSKERENLLQNLVPEEGKIERGEIPAEGEQGDLASKHHLLHSVAENKHKEQEFVCSPPENCC